eukprot:48918-Rhodomonas_salina.1
MMIRGLVNGEMERAPGGNGVQSDWDGRSPHGDNLYRTSLKAIDRHTATQSHSASHTSSALRDQRADA